jgi:two-component system, chemotaxis family, CheB/CheR fusion protein
VAAADKKDAEGAEAMPVPEVPGDGEDFGCPVVGVGASAGGLAAFEAFFSGMPADRDPGMAFVLVQHLAPDHQSILAELVRRYTRMQVLDVEDGMVVKPNCTYIIPPNRDMAFLHGALQLLEPVTPRGRRLPIDFFFRSLALDRRERAIGVVLSGTGTDGTQGVRAIKGEGGMIMVQHPASTEYDGMPRSALATGLVDYELPPAEMAAQLMAYVAHSYGRPPRPAAAPPPQAESAIKKILVLLRVHSGHDFSQYKQGTVHRRIERRMALHQVDSIDNYVKHLQQSAAELESLFRDLLIGVTSFFRDPAAFEALQQQVIKSLLAERAPGSPVRVWSAGCSTGEEAYSLAILFAECQEALKQSYRVQVFATDLDSRAIATARAGVYPANIAADVPPERLARFFSVEPDSGSYRIHKAIRDMVVFSEQDIVRDPPFSKLDLISCRNLLIYTGGELQRKVIPLFHYALNPGGYLYLGTSESVGEFNELFSAVDRKLKIYRRRDQTYKPQGGFSCPVPRGGAAIDSAMPPGAPAAGPKPGFRELTETTLLRQFDSAGALINAQGDIYYLHGRTGMYLEPPAGEVGVSNVLKMAREGLRRDLVMALHQAVSTNEPVRRAGLMVKTNGGFSAVDLTVCLVPASRASHAAGPLFLVILDAAKPAPDQNAPAPLPVPGRGGDADARVAALQQELKNSEEYLRTTNEELETTNEELRSSNEELQAVNEELQSAVEELETSKEELQSLNEELATVNAELQTKVADLSRANSDMNNLLAGTGIGTIFVDHELHILRFTPAATRLINLIGSDVGRPLHHVLSNLVGQQRLQDDVRRVLENLMPQETEVQATTGEWYSMRIQPYRTLSNVIEGAVITFVDISAAKEARNALRDSELRTREILESISGGFISLDDGMLIRYVNPAAERMFGWRAAELNGRKVFEVFQEPQRREIEESCERSIQTREPVSFETRIDLVSGEKLCRVLVYPAESGTTVFFQKVLGSV